MIDRTKRHGEGAARATMKAAAFLLLLGWAPAFSGRLAQFAMAQDPPARREGTRNQQDAQAPGHTQRDAGTRTTPTRKASHSAKAESPHRALAEVLERNLPAWTGGSGVIERHRLQALASNPKIQREDAAALAALLRETKKSPHPMRANAVQSAANEKLEHDYNGMVAKLAKIDRVLFVNGRPDFEKMQQGPAGDCFVFSGAGWMAHFHPERIVQMIRPLPDGRFHVRFPDGEEAVVTAPTDTELAYNESGSTATDGIWMAVLEKAVGTIEARHNAKAQAIPDPSLRVNLGGSTRFDVHRWTGRQVAKFSLHDRRQHARIREALLSMQRKRLMAQAVVPHTDPPGPLPGNHAYAILAFDSRRDVLTVWNPWGDNFQPKGPEGVEHGWPRRHGIFQIPLADFVRVFSSLDIEER